MVRRRLHEVYRELTATRYVTELPQRPLNNTWTPTAGKTLNF